MSIEQLNIIIASATTGFATVAIALATFFNSRSKSRSEENHDLIMALKTEMTEWKEQSIRYQAIIEVKDQTIALQDKKIELQVQTIEEKTRKIEQQAQMILKFSSELEEMKITVMRVEEENIELKKQMDIFLNLKK